MPTDRAENADGLWMDCPRHGRVAVSKIWAAEGGCYACGLEAQANEMGWAVPTPSPGYVDPDGATPRSITPIQNPKKGDEAARLRAKLARLVDALTAIDELTGPHSSSLAADVHAVCRAALAAAKEE